MTDISWLTARPIAHRGFHDLNNKRWENTLSAFSAAIERGYAIECDVHLSADGVPIVIHDDDLRRLTGTEGFVWQRTAAEMAQLRIGGTGDHPPTLKEMLDLVDGRVPLVVEIKGVPGHDAGLVKAVGRLLKRYDGQVAIMSFDHWLIREFSTEAPGIPGGLTAYGTGNHEIEAHFAMLAHGIAFTSYAAGDLPNRFVSFVRGKLAMPVITWTIRDQPAIDLTFKYADQMTFEGFEPDPVRIA
ncbi:MULTISPECIES: glycerophosphodiester phosphodiesterase [Phyllobacteriaceae]|jgi:glycerophosphoryl diester phosphodiesterase|uniref:Glycerophosphodiester phosphodiesterase n=1 Tax=Mesorhizobium hungaricum TaxID=1566387 RepID=A0A1C2DSX4_9HYPH|nr:MULTISPECIES: glycerophosphodiester phosphodiesterase [Mesorhizobium]MBN9236223.1 glycerophosphodiester phosphodiesterase [Mesorhizobium sp.]MDQ0327877.1 glycerophosphoryl diester phosphodiesterase [Mesorhizobium sp. YL-MeA3-2017]OCX17745.1 glycerophosphodiester phosphodiesterase [Mesorhizobium hungaricum]